MEKYTLPTLEDLIKRLLTASEFSKKIVLIRHGQSQGNVSSVLHGSAEYELTERGIAQAKEIGDGLDPFVDQIRQVRTSTMIRSIQTCHHILNVDLRHEWKGKIIYDYRLRELPLGVMEGTWINREEISREDYIAMWHSLYAGHVVPLGSEGGKKFNERVMESLREAVDGLNVYFAHSGVIYTIIMQKLEKTFLGNCGAIALGFNEKNDEFELIGLYEGHRV